MKVKIVEVMVGMFIVAGIAALFMLAMKVSNLSSLSDQVGYELIARFDNVGGLKAMSAVNAGGVRVGRVVSVDYDQDKYEAEVHMVINSRYDRFPKDTSAAIYTAGLLGEQYVSLEPGAEDVFLKDGDEIQLTQSALVMEKVVGQFLFSKAAEGPASN
jgi:phospholipid/cholesterol/gamma-HCH transport system substrate-binding protein